MMCLLFHEYSWTRNPRGSRRNRWFEARQAQQIRNNIARRATQRHQLLQKISRTRTTRISTWENSNSPWERINCKIRGTLQPRLRTRHQAAHESSKVLVFHSLGRTWCCRSLTRLVTPMIAQTWQRSTTRVSWKVSRSRLSLTSWVHPRAASVSISCSSQPARPVPKTLGKMVVRRWRTASSLASSAWA